MIRGRSVIDVATKATDVMKLSKFRPARALFALPLLLLGGCSMNSLETFYTAGVVGKTESDVIIFVTVLLMVFVFLPVAVATFYFAWHYRESNSKAGYSPNWSHSNLLEVFLWGGPILIIVILGALSIMTNYKLDPYKVVSSDKAQTADPVEVRAIAMDWKWLFIYPKYNIASVNELAMPVDTPITIHLTSDSVMTAFMIPRMGSQIYAMAGMRTMMNLLPTRKGDFIGRNYQYNGNGFAKMKFHVDSMSAQDFKNWINKAKQSGDKLTWQRYNLLAAPAVMQKTIYFSSVKPNLFYDVIADYHKGTPRNRMTRTAER